MLALEIRLPAGVAWMLKPSASAIRLSIAIGECMLVLESSYPIGAVRMFKLLDRVALLMYCCTDGWRLLLKAILTK